MIHWHIYTAGLTAIGMFAFVGWLLSLARDNVTHVDSMWSIFIGMGAYTYALFFFEITPRCNLVLWLVTIWAVRLSAYLTWRNWGPHEDRRYATIRKNNEPHFWLKSIYIVFALQAVLAWVVTMPLFGAIESKTELNHWDYLGATIVIAGILWESVADWQLMAFKSNPQNHNKVLDTGLWRYSRHPNYFGEFCVWWGFYLIAYAGGAWWSLASPILMTLLLLKISGVSLLEKDIGDRRPEYADYTNRTNAFIPGVPKN